jgi:SGNH domain (fused to AT3 domains)
MAPSSNDAAIDRACIKFNQSALQHVVSDPTIQFVVLVANWAGPAEWFQAGNGYSTEPGAKVTLSQSNTNFESGLRGTVAALRAAGKRVILFEDIESLKFDPVRRVRAYFIPARGWIARHVQNMQGPPGSASSDELYLPENAEASQIVNRVARDQNAIVFDPRPRLCADGSCKYYAGQTLLYANTNHLTAAGAELVMRDPPLLLAGR